LTRRIGERRGSVRRGRSGSLVLGGPVSIRRSILSGEVGGLQRRCWFPADTAKGPLHPPQRAENRGLPRRELGVSAGLRGGPGRTRTGNQTVISPQPASSSRRGRIPDKQLPQDDDTTARFAAECQSFLRPSSMPCSCAPHSELAGWGLITVWLPVRVLPAPPRSPHEPCFSR
jgi:hypothetical protein